ncbi:MAG TPA: hypothetical protein DCK95_03535 [Anaerolineaceae bacterium]|nr:hypothetical protein [Anaerolineaceae bacterium]
MNSPENKLDNLTRKFWFYLVIIIAMFAIPSVAQEPFDSRDTTKVITAVLQNALIYQYPALFPIFKIIPIILVALVFIQGEKATRIFDIYAACILLITAIFQNMAYTKDYGKVMLLGNQIILGLLALLWIWEAIVQKNKFYRKKRPAGKYWVFIPALLAFWFPIDVQTMQPDFSLGLIFTSEAGLTWCMIVPLILAMLIFFEPNINRPLARVTAFIGLIIALMNMLNWFVLSHNSWIGILHFPLLILSVYTCIISFKKEGLSTPEQA